MNVQYAIKKDEIYVIEVNPRASRTVPFVSKATGVPWAKIAAKVMAGKSLDELGVIELQPPRAHFGQGSRLPLHANFPASTSSSAPKCAAPAKSWASIAIFRMAYAKAQIAAGTRVADEGIRVHFRAEWRQGIGHSRG